MRFDNVLYANLETCLAWRQTDFMSLQILKNVFSMLTFLGYTLF